MLSEKLILDIDRIIYKAEKEKEKCEEKGKEAKALEIAKNMLDDGMTVEQIKILTKLPLSKIKKLQKPK